MTAREALERARATLKCGRDGAMGALPIRSCQFMQPGDKFELWSAFGSPQARWSNRTAHEVTASLLLDGVSVDEITAAERELER